MAHGAQVHVSELGTCVVVDGDALLLTPLRHSVVPPPMCAARARLPRPVAALAVSSGWGAAAAGWGEEAADERVAAVLSDGRLALLRCVEDDLWEETAEVRACASMP